MFIFCQSDGFAYYPLWPSEMVNALDGGDDTEIARHSVALYVGLGGIGVRPVLEFSAAVRAGAPAAVPKGCRLNCTVPAAVSGSGIVANFEKFLDGAQRGSFLPAAPGGGTENVGIVQAINDMLVQAPGGKFIALFPVWDRTQVRKRRFHACAPFSVEKRSPAKTGSGQTQGNSDQNCFFLAGRELLESSGERGN